jgi:hypothetical protein
VALLLVDNVSFGNNNKHPPNHPVVQEDATNLIIQLTDSVDCRDEVGGIFLHSMFLRRALAMVISLILPWLHGLAGTVVCSCGCLSTFCNTHTHRNSIGRSPGQSQGGAFTLRPRMCSLCWTSVWPLVGLDVALAELQVDAIVIK